MGSEYIRQIMVLGLVPSLGPVVLFDDIEDLFKWVEGGTGGDTVFEKIATVAYNGSACLHVKTRTTNAAANDNILATRSTFQRPGRRYRLDVLFRLEVLANCKMLTFRCRTYDGSNLHTVAIRYDPQNTKWQYMNLAGAETDIVGGSQNLVAAGFHRLLVEWDESKGEYTKFICDGLEIDMSGLAYSKSASAGAVRILLDLEIKAQSTTPPEAYFDDVLVMEI